MRNIFIIIALLVLCGCGSPRKQDAFTGMKQQAAIGAVAAMFFCKNQRWPQSLKELQDFESKKGFDMPMKVDWDWFARPGVEFIVGEELTIKTPPEKSRNMVSSMASKIAKPVCDRTKKQPNAEWNT